MALYNVLIKSQTASLNIDSYNRSAVCDTDIENGSVFKLSSYSVNPGEGMVWRAEQAATTDKGLWMAASPEVVITKVMDNVEYKGIVEDPRAFINIAGHMIDAFKLAEGDVIEMTGANITGIDTNAYLTPDTTGFKLKAGAAAGTGLTLKKLGTSILHIGNSSLVKTPTKTYKFVVEIN